MARNLSIKEHFEMKYKIKGNNIIESIIWYVIF